MQALGIVQRVYGDVRVRVDQQGGWQSGRSVEFAMPERLKDVVVGDAYDGCGRRDDNTVACWLPAAFRNLIPPPTGTLVQFAGHGDTFCGVRGDGSITCWGDPWPGHDLTGSALATGRNRIGEP